MAWFYVILRVMILVAEKMVPEMVWISRSLRWTFFSVLMTSAMLLCDTSRISAQDIPHESDVRVGNILVYDAKWRATLNDRQRLFFDLVYAAAGTGWIDGLPYTRLISLYQQQKLDCIVAGRPGPQTGKIISTNNVNFTLKLFTHAGKEWTRHAPPSARPLIVGHLATLPNIALPLERKVIWYGIHSFDQGLALVKAGRIDLLIADEARFDNDPVVQPLGKFPIRVVDMVLQCNDSVKTRNFISQFDQRFNHALPR
ncbi:hypothetical protein LPB41_30385 [Thalassospira sp. MA62]|nr:hypothetical protein [Thalassospira sp. MA62]